MLPRVSRIPLRLVRRLRAKRLPAPEPPQELRGVPLFDWPFYEEITEARLAHLGRLDLPLSGKSVIDVGCGIGRLSEFFVERGCEVLSVDGREENIAELRRLYPGRRAAVVDVEHDDLSVHGEFDIVFCYGLLYHLADPLAFLRRAAAICQELMLVETCVTDAEDPIVVLVRDPDDPTMSLHSLASRPSPAYVAAGLRSAGFEHVYSPTTLPDHRDFRYERLNDLSHLRDGNALRDIFVASRRELDNPRLRPLPPW